MDIPGVIKKHPLFSGYHLPFPLGSSLHLALLLHKALALFPDPAQALCHCPLCA